MRPRLLVVVTGTATEVGKTWVSCSLLRLARSRGLSVAARKPAQSFEAESSLASTDAAQLAAASGALADDVCPPQRSYPVPMAPPMAAAALGRPVPATGDLVSWVAESWPSTGSDLGLVEGAGGVASPLAGDGDSAGLARDLGADRVVLVADPALGVINSVRLSVAALAPLSVVVHLNRFDAGDDLQRRNLAWLRDEDGLSVTTTVEELLDSLGGSVPAPPSPARPSPAQPGPARPGSPVRDGAPVKVGRMATRPPSPRIPPLPAEERSPSVQALLETVTVAGADANIFTTLARAEGLTRRWLPFGGKLLNGKIPARDRELLILRTGWNCRAEYEWAQHVVIGLDAGLTREEIDRVPAGPDAAGWSAFDAALLRAADELHRDWCIADATWGELAERYDTNRLIELPMLVGHYHMVAMTLNSLGVQLDPGLSGFPGG